jgi:tetratricopeptide (TPR) repeat protein
MRKILFISGALVLGLSVTSCKKFLTEEPLMQVPTENFFNSLGDVEAAMAGIYGSFQTEMTGRGGTGSSVAFSGKYHYWGEGRSDNFESGQYANSVIRELSQNTLTSGNSVSNWEGFYRTIGRANIAIQNIPKAASKDVRITPILRDNFLAQSYAMRALSYFYIVRLWGDAPIWTEVYDDYTKDSKKARESKDKIMNEIIIPDLEKAYSLIQKNQTANVWNLNEGAIAAVMADVYMWKAGTENSTQSYNDAITWFENVFKSKAPTGKVFGGTTISDLEVMDDWKNKLFLAPNTSKESIWSIHWDPTVNGCACIPVSVGTSNNPVRIDSVIHRDWRRDKTDRRVVNTLDTSSSNTGNIDKLTKYYNIPVLGRNIPASPAAVDRPVYLVMYRLGDVYLSYAEALNRTGNGAEALKYLNFIRERAGKVALDPSDFRVADEESLAFEIIQERRLELFGEGKRWFDLVRTNNVNRVMDDVINRRLTDLQGGIPFTEGFGSDMGRVLWPIFRTLLEDNKKLVQNPSYR